jgi:hypothetical protein
MERVAEPDRRRAIGYVLTVFQRLNASSVAAVKSALATRRERLRRTLSEVVRETPDGDLFDDRYRGEQEEQDGPSAESREIIESEVVWLDRLLAMNVPRQRKAVELEKLLAQIDRESPRGDRERVLIFTEYRRTQEFLVGRLEARYGAGTVALIHGEMHLDGKRASQRAFRDEERVRFLVSTEAGGEGINLQFCHVLVNYDLPWNPMRVEQRVGRIYRFGQEKIVQIYNFSNEGTVEDRVRVYFDQRVRLAAKALCAVTGEDPEEVSASLGAQLDCEIEPDEIYRRSLVEGALNPQSRKEIEAAVRRAHEAYEIATNSLFRDVSAYSFDRYRRELATDVTLEDLRQVTEAFLRNHGRQPQWKDGWLGFRVPDDLKHAEKPERIDGVTFDRETAIRHPEKEFFAIGHEFVDAMLHHVGDPAFGGYAARRVLVSPDLQGQTGVQFNFLVRSQVPREDGDEYLFDFHCVVLDEQLQPDERLKRLAENSWSAQFEGRSGADLTWDWERAYDAAKTCLTNKLANLWDWDEEVILLNAAEITVIG